MSLVLSRPFPLARPRRSIGDSTGRRRGAAADIMGAARNDDDPSDNGDDRARRYLDDIEADDNWDFAVRGREISAGPSQAGLYRLGKTLDFSLGDAANNSLSERARQPGAAEPTSIENQVDLYPVRVRAGRRGRDSTDLPLRYPRIHARLMVNPDRRAARDIVRIQGVDAHIILNKQLKARQHEARDLCACLQEHEWDMTIYLLLA